MLKKKILIVARSFYPQNSPRSFRTTELVKEFARKGHEVTVIIPKKDEVHIPFEQDYKIKIKNLGKIKFKKIDFESGSKMIIRLKRILRRSLNLFLNYPDIELLFLVKKALKNEKNYDLLVSIAAPHAVHWGVAWAWTKKKGIAKIWVADCGDPFMMDKNDSFRKLFYFKFFEKYWNKKCDYISVPFKGSFSGYYQEFHHKIRVIPQGFSFPELNKKKEVNNSVTTFVYSGNIGSYRHYYEPFFELLKKTKSDFKFIIFTKEKNIYLKGLHNILDKVDIHNYVPREQLFKTLANADFLVHFPYLNEQQKSLKLIDYNYVKTPILSYEGVIDDEIFEQFLKGDFRGRMLEEDIENFKIKNVAQQFLELAR